MRSCLALLGVVMTVLAAACGPAAPETVTVYTSMDQPLSEPILRDFEARSGIRVEAVYDVEAAKTTGLVSRLAAERAKPRADVFWSSEFVQTLRLKDDGLLEAYDSPSAASIPAAYRDPERYWTGFAARARVILVNTRLVPKERYPRSIFDLLDPSWGPGEVGIANPLFGTTASHAAALFAALGPEQAQAFHLSLRDHQVRVVDGNSVVRDMVVSGELKVGLTDTDDANDALQKGAQVAMIFPDQDAERGLGTFIIPNTAALVRGAPHRTAGQRLIDYLLSTEVETKLAESGSLQMPVREGVPAPPEVPQLSSLRAMSVSAAEAAGQFALTSAWLRETFLR